MQINYILRYLRGLSIDDVDIIAKRSYIHPNGFVKIVLEKFEDGSTIRLHCFTKEQSYFHAHDQSASFKAKVLVGVLKDSYYTVSEGSKYNEYSLSLDNKSRCSFTSIRTCDLIPITPCYLFQGMKYSIEPEVIYKTECLTKFAILLVDQDATLKKSCNVYVPVNEILEQDVVYPHLSRDELVDLIRRIIYLLNLNK